MRKTEAAANAGGESLGLSHRRALIALLPAFATYALPGEVRPSAGPHRRFGSPVRTIRAKTTTLGGRHLADD